MDKRGNISSRNMRLFAAIMTLIEHLSSYHSQAVPAKR